MGFVARPSIQEFSILRPVDRPGQLYFDWVDREVPGVRAVWDGGQVGLHLFGMDRPAILLKPSPEPGGEAYEVCGGLLVHEPAGGRFVFEVPSPDRLRIVLEGFTPRLPRTIFVLTHALVHEFVMWSFRRHMQTAQLEAF